MLCICIYIYVYIYIYVFIHYITSHLFYFIFYSWMMDDHDFGALKSVANACSDLPNSLLGMMSPFSGHVCPPPSSRSMPSRTKIEHDNSKNLTFKQIR